MYVKLIENLYLLLKCCCKRITTKASGIHLYIKTSYSLSLLVMDHRAEEGFCEQLAVTRDHSH